MGLHISDHALEPFGLLHQRPHGAGVPVAVQRVQEHEELALHHQREALRPRLAGPVGGIEGRGGRVVEGGARADGPVEQQRALPEGLDHVVAAPVVRLGAVQYGQGEDDVLILHGPVGGAVDGVQLPRQHRHDAARLHRVALQIHRHRAPALLDVDHFHLVVPVQVHTVEVQRDRAQVGLVGKTRLFVQLGLLVLRVFLQLHVHPSPRG